MKGKSPKQGLISAENLAIELTEGLVYITAIYLTLCLRYLHCFLIVITFLLMVLSSAVRREMVNGVRTILFFT